MAGWSILADGSVVECLEILHYLQSNGFCLGLDASLKGSLSGCKDKLRCLFDHILTVFLKDICIGHELRCLPSMLGDGQCVDLFKLFWVVRHKGGYDCVCKDEKWSSVAEESGFDSGVASSLKLIYVKYLYTLDRWLQRIFKDKGVRRGLSDSSGDLGVLPAELRTEFKGMLSELSDQMNIDGRQIQLDSGKNEFLLPAMDSGKNEFLLPVMDSGRKEFPLSATGDLDYKLDVPNVMQADGGKNYVDDDEERTYEFPLSATGDSDYKLDVPNVMQADGGKNYVDDDKERTYEFPLSATGDSDYKLDVPNVMQADGGKNYVDDDEERTYEFPLSATGDSDYKLDVPNVMQADGGKNYVDDDEEVEMLDCGADICSRKRKREWFFSGMLNWVIEAAKDPCDLTIGIIPEWSKWKSHEGNEFWVQALLAREALLMKKQICSTSEQSIFQKKQKMHPSMYEDPVDGNHQSTERLRCSQRILSLKNSFSPAPSLSSSSSRSNPKTSLTPSIAALENYQNRKHVPVDSSTPIVVGVSSDDHLQQHVSVGPLFQARVPDWTGVPSESDCKWLGTQVWPLETGQYYTLIESDPIGKGRQYWCDCRLPGSVECVRFHIAEKRMRLKIELGSAFHIWKFNDMGEEVSLPWTEEEEKKFKAIVRLNPPSLGRTFWDQIYKCFPNKKRRDLVSYYFNAFLLRRRSYQNRVTPNSIDSDDDESEFGSVSNGFGHEAVKVADSNSVLCVQNEQCIDLEEHA